MILEIKTFSLGFRIGDVAPWNELNIEFLGPLTALKTLEVKNNHAHVTLQIFFEQIHQFFFFGMYGLAVFLYVARLIISKNIDKMYIVKAFRIFLMNNEKSTNSEKN